MGENPAESLCRWFYIFCATPSTLRRIFLEPPAIEVTPAARLLTNNIKLLRLIGYHFGYG